MSATPHVGIVLLQMGTPAAATVPALRQYLRQFLSDPRVVDLPRALWWPILTFAVLPRRPARSAALYRKVWTPEGSPLLVLSQHQAAGVSAGLEAGRVSAVPNPARVSVALAMRYGNPSTEAAVDQLLAAGCNRLLAFPMYPQYASATTGSSLEELFAVIAKRRVVPAVRVVPPYYEDRAYIHALAASVRDVWRDWAPDYLLISFHGLPKRYTTLGDPYEKQCQATAHALVAELGIPASQVRVTFQSRFGREEWLQPYTDHTLRELGHKRTRRLLAMCPGFTADCLETLEEIGITGREQFHEAGGGDYRVIPCLNDSRPWIDAMTSIARRELGGWI